MNIQNFSQPLKIGLVQINNAFSGQHYLPYSVGLLQAYIEKYAQEPERYTFLEMIHSRMPVAAAVEALRTADIVGFSAYVWNINISLKIANSLKKVNPDVLIVFGGPQVPDKAEQFLRDNPFIDLVCHGEGEAVFLSIVENHAAANWQDIPSISYIARDGTLVNNPKTQRITNLSEIPSPYLENVFASLMQANPQTKWLALWETNRGCPFSCTFCDWGSATAAKVYTFDMERLYQEIEWFAGSQIEFIFCCDANFGILPRDYDIVEYAAGVKQRSGYPQALSVQNTKNATERAYQVQKRLAEAGLNKGVTLSFQSVDPNTLKKIKRQNISSESFQELQRRFTRDRIETYSDLILGLPGETYETFVSGISHMIEKGQHNRIQFNNLSIMPNAEMGDPEYQKTYGMQLVKSKIINIHGSLSETQNDITEFQDLVVGTESMPMDDWVKVRAFCWMAAFLHFDKIFQIPLVLIHENSSLSYRDLIETLMLGGGSATPIINEMREFFIAKAIDIQTGGPEYCHSAEWLNIWWPADEYMLIKLCTENKLNDFYHEAEQLLMVFLAQKGIHMPVDLLHESVEINKNHIRLPFQTEDLIMQTSYNIWEFYKSILQGQPGILEKKEHTYCIDRTSFKVDTWEQWYQEVIWYGNKKGAYLYGNDSAGLQIEGHY